MLVKIMSFDCIHKDTYFAVDISLTSDTLQCQKSSFILLG